MIYGYARVSTAGQSVTAQVAALREAGADKIYKETACGARQDRPELKRLLRELVEGDTLLITRLDRLARSTAHLLLTLDDIGKKGATFRSLKEKWADTTTAHGRLMITLLAGIAAFERELILARTSEGRAIAKQNGVKFGPKFKLTPHQKKEALARRERGELLTAIARSYNVSDSTISRLRA